MKRRRLPVDVVITAASVILVGALAFFQYRWLGSVSDAERARLRASLKQHADDFARDVDRGITDIYNTFQTAGTVLARGDAPGFVSRVDDFLRSSPNAGLVKGIYRITSDGALEHYAAGAFTSVEWPDELHALQRGRATNVGTMAPFDTVLRHATGPVVVSVPAIVIPLPAVRPFEGLEPLPSERPSVFSFRFDVQSMVLWLDREYLTKTFLPAMAERSFPSASPDFRLSVVDGGDPPTAFFSRGVREGAQSIRTGRCQ